MNEFKPNTRPDTRELHHIVTELQAITDQLLDDVKDENWEAFLQHAQQRALLLEQFQDKTKALHSQQLNEPWDDLNHWVKNEFRKVAKVDMEIGDIMNSKRDELINKIMGTRNGQRFLKNYKNSVNFERIVSKIY